VYAFTIFRLNLVESMLVTLVSYFSRMALAPPGSVHFILHPRFIVE
jgi:hypothetical protein